MIPVNEPVLGALESKYVNECLETGWISSAGRFIEAFEGAWADYCGMRYGVAVANGTVALELAVWSLELDPGDEIIMPTFTIASCALAAIRNGCVPVLVDADPETWCLDVTRIQDRITSRTRAIMPVHIYGHPVDMDPVRSLADAYGLYVIEDAAEAHGATYRDRRCGGLGDISCFSFYANKIVTTGEGGMLLTNDDKLARRAREGRNLCFGAGNRFRHTEAGYNFRLTNLQAAIGLAQTERVDELVARKRRIGARYNELLSDLPLQLPVEREWATNVYWMYGIVLTEETGIDAETLGERLIRLGVQTRPFFVGMHDQPMFLERGMFAGEGYPVSDRLSRLGLYLPSGLAITAEQQDMVASALREALGA